MITKAIAKIQSQNTDDMSGVIARYLIGITTNQAVAQKLLDKEKTLAGCVTEVRNKARKRASNGVAMIEDNEVYGWAREHFGINELDLSPHPVQSTAQQKTISIFDFME